jgi:hypothetical protein
MPMIGRLFSGFRRLCLLRPVVFLACGYVLSNSVWSQEAGKENRLAYVAESTKKVCQLTGEDDRQTKQPTPSRTQSSAGVLATDLGSSFEHDGKLFFLFGDTWGKPGVRDALAWTESRDPEKIELKFLTGSDGKWLPLTVPGIKHGAFEVPSYGVSIEGKIYVVFTTDHSPSKTMGRSVLAVSPDGGKTFRQVYDLSASKFINVALWKSERWLYVFGSGDYRRSSACLARVELESVENRGALRFFRGLSPDGEPQWSEQERDAESLFRHDVVGELSVAFCPPVERYIMLYNSSSPRGIVMRSAERPWGPWSEAEIIFNPWRDKGYGQFMHASNLFRKNPDNLSDPKRGLENGGEYGPYIMARYTTAVGGGCRIYYTMSTWNPYQVVVMQSDLRLEPREAK